MKRECRAFTLIELLIVVAIIAILAAIAIPNFLEAQTRARVARVQSEFRNMKTAMFAYRVDFAWWPPDDDAPDGIDHSTLLNLTELSTPVAYMSSVPYQDPFSTVKKNTSVLGPVANHYQYFLEGLPGPDHNGSIKYWWGATRGNNGVRYIDWTITCVGPTQDWPPTYGPTPFFPGIPYDGTNGTMSFGTLWVSDVGIFGD